MFELATVLRGYGAVETWTRIGSNRVVGGAMHYYESGDLKRFSEVGEFASESMKKFFDYYDSATSADGALPKKTKKLIALAMAHAEQCPYCIDAFTEQCLEAGANPEEMTEAIHVASAMKAGATLVHGVQMHNAMKRRGL